LPGRTAAQAREAFLAPLQRSLSCISSAQLWVPASKRPGENEAILLSKDPLPLHSDRIGDVQLVLGHQFKVVKDGPNKWHISTVAYRYHLLDPNGREMLAWHWHPGTGTDHPHMHVSSGLIGRHVHIPTGRVSIEAVLWLLLGDLQVKPTRDHKSDWTEILATAERPFIRHRRWHARGPDDE
jgi:hypothetical protein